MQGNALRGQVVHEHRRALGHGQQRILLDLRVGRQHPFRQALYYALGQVEVLHAQCVIVPRLGRFGFLVDLLWYW